MQTIEHLKSNKAKYQKVFFYRVCGTGMGAAACLMREKGFDVEGADENFYPPMSDYLEETGIPCFSLKDIDEEALKKYDLIVVGNVVPRGSDAAQLIEQCGVDYCSFPAALGAFILEDVHVIGIAGTHGKTTTSYYLTQMLESAGEKPGYFIGGVIEGRPSAALGAGKYFVIESDEYDSAYFEKISKFRSYCINDLVLTSLEYDHADIFSSIEDIKNEFRALLQGFQGSVVYNKDYQASFELSQEFKQTPWLAYSENNDVITVQNESPQEGTLFTMNLDGESISFETNIIGMHNILNISSCVLIMKKLGFTIDSIKSAAKKLKHVKRRQEERGTFQGALVIDDFAHHPKSVFYTIDAIRTRYLNQNKKLMVVLEPNSATARSNIFQQEFAESLEQADTIVLAKAARDTTAKNASNLDYEQVVQSLNQHKERAWVVADLEALMGILKQQVNKDTIVLVLSNGTCLGLWQSDFLDH